MKEKREKAREQKAKEIGAEKKKKRRRKEEKSRDISDVILQQLITD